MPRLKRRARGQYGLADSHEVGKESQTKTSEKSKMQSLRKLVMEELEESFLRGFVAARPRFVLSAQRAFVFRRTLS